MAPERKGNAENGEGGYREESLLRAGRTESDSDWSASRDDEPQGDEQGDWHQGSNGIQPGSGPRAQHGSRQPFQIGSITVPFSEQDRSDLRHARTLVTAANICGIFSLFLGGIVLGTIGLVSGILGYRRLAAIGARYPHDPRIAEALKRLGRTSIIICAVALALNAISLIVLYPAINEAVQSGDYSNLLNGFNLGQSGSGLGTGNAGGGASAPNTTWG